MSQRTLDLEDRLLVLKNKFDVLNKAYNPNEPRDKDGKWTKTGEKSDFNVAKPAPTGNLPAVIPQKSLVATTEPNTDRRTFLRGLASVATNASRIGSVLSNFANVQVRLPKVAEAVKTTFELALEEMDVFAGDKGNLDHKIYSLKGFKLPTKFEAGYGNYPGWEKADTIDWDLADKLFSILRTKGQFHNALTGHLTDRTLGPNYTKYIERVVAQIGNSIFENFEEQFKDWSDKQRTKKRAQKKSATKLEDRVLILQNKADVLNKAFNPNQPRDKQGQWTDTGGVSSPNIISNIHHGNWKLNDFRHAKIRDMEQRDIDAYNNLAPTIRPVEFKKQFLRGLADNSTLSLRNHGVVHNVLGAASILNDKAGRTLGSLERTFDMEGGKKFAHHDSFSLLDTEQGKGIAKPLLAGQIELYKQLGIERVELEANVDMGSYAWAKYGFVPVRQGFGWDRLRSQIADRYNLGQERGFYGNDHDTPVFSAVSSDDPRAVWAISDLTAPIHNKHDASLEFGEQFYGGREFLPSPDKFNTLGKYLLGNTYWDGKLDLKNVEQMGRFNAYIKR